jgi:hypothetical protein
MTAVSGVLLAATIVLIEARMEDSWSRGVQFVIALAAFAVLFGLAFRMTPQEGQRPSAAQSALLVSGLAALVAAVLRFGEVTGVDEPGDSEWTVIWMSLLFAAIALVPAWRLDSAVCTLAAAIAFGIAATEFAHKALGADSNTSFRWTFLVLVVLYAAAAFVLRRVRSRHSAQLVNSAMIATLALLETAGAGIIFFYSEGELSTWWEAVILAAPFAAILYGMRTRERGPAWLGGVALLVALAAVADTEGLTERHKASLVGWPLVLLGRTAAGFMAAFLAGRRT